MPYVTPLRLEQIVNVPFSLAETELRRGKTMAVWAFDLVRGQRLEVRCMNLHIHRVLNPGVNPERANTSMGLCSVGLLFGPMVSSSACSVISSMAGVTNQSVTSFNSFTKRTFVTPGPYRIVVSNNTTNVDFSLIVTGAVKLYF